MCVRDAVWGTTDLRVTAVIEMGDLKWTLF